MSDKPTITAEDRAAAEEIEPPLTTDYPLEKIERDRRIAKNAAIIARHREQREKRLVEALRKCREAVRRPQNAGEQTVELITRQALTEAGYDQ